VRIDRLIGQERTSRGEMSCKRGLSKGVKWRVGGVLRRSRNYGGRGKRVGRAGREGNRSKITEWTAVDVKVRRSLRREDSRGRDNTAQKGGKKERNYGSSMRGVTTWRERGAKGGQENSQVAKIKETKKGGGGKIIEAED